MNPLHLLKRLGGTLRALVVWLEFSGFFGLALVKGVVGRGSTLHINVAGSPTNFLKIGNVTDISGPGGQAPIIDVTNLDSLAREKLMGLPDEGQITFNLNLDPDDSTHQAVRNARKNETLCEFKLTLTDTSPTIAIFFGYVTTFSHSLGIDSAVKVAVTIEIDGQINWQ